MPSAMLGEIILNVSKLRFAQFDKKKKQAKVSNERNQYVNIFKFLNCIKNLSQKKCTVKIYAKKTT